MENLKVSSSCTFQNCTDLWNNFFLDFLEFLNGICKKIEYLENVFCIYVFHPCQRVDVYFTP
jgi:hypothetical protein